MRISLLMSSCVIVLASAVMSGDVRSAPLAPQPSTPCSSNNLGDQQETLKLFGDGTGNYATYKCVIDSQGYHWELLGISPCIVGPNGCIKI